MDGLVNIQKFRMLSSSVELVRQMQQEAYNLQHLAEVTGYFKREFGLMLDDKTNWEKELYNKAKKLQQEHLNSGHH